MKRVLLWLPLVLLVGFGGLGLIQLFDGHKPGFERVSREAPTRLFEPLGGGEARAFPDLATDEPIIVNLWASWCAPCVAEHPLLTELSRAYPGRVHGLVFDDTEANARDFLERLGNPFTFIGMDPTGQGALDFGHTGVPETFVITPEGEITLHLRGQLTSQELPELQAAMGPPEAGPS